MESVGGYFIVGRPGWEPRLQTPPSFLRKQESMLPPGNPERLDSCLRRNDGKK
jgi:hypothetical protein